MEIEQYYLKKYSPSLNINKIAGSLLGYKHTKANLIKFSLLHRGKFYKRTSTINTDRPLVGNNTIIKLKLRSRDAPVCIYDTNLNLVKSLSTIK